MKTIMMSVYDNKARVYCSPFFVLTEEVGMRTFAQCANDPSHPIARSPEDYTLVVLGTFDDDSGCVDVKAHILQLGLARAFQRSPGELAGVNAAAQAAEQAFAQANPTTNRTHNHK